MKKSAPFIFLLALALSACSEKPSPAPSAPSMPVHKIGVDPVQVEVLEQGSGNIPHWLKNGAHGRVLVHISAQDGLAPLPDVSLATLKSLAEKGDFEALRAMGDASRPGALYSSRSVVFLAHRLGMVDSVYWVVPTFQSISAKNLKDLKDHLISLYPDKAEDIDGMKLSGSVVEGRINGVPLKLVCLQDLPAVDKPVLLDIDGSFLFSLYQDEKKTRILPMVSGLFATLKDKGLTSDMVTVVTSNADGTVPVKFRFLSGYLTSLFLDPGMVEKSPPPLWADRAKALKAEQKSTKDAIPLYKKILKDYPGDAASRYDLSYCYFMAGDLESCLRELETAVRLDQGYRYAYLEYADSLTNAGKADRAGDFMAAVQNMR